MFVFRFWWLNCSPCNILSYIQSQSGLSIKSKCLKCDSIPISHYKKDDVHKHFVRNLSVLSFSLSLHPGQVRLKRNLVFNEVTAWVSAKLVIVLCSAMNKKEIGKKLDKRNSGDKRTAYCRMPSESPPNLVSYLVF